MSNVCPKCHILRSGFMNKLSMILALVSLNAWGEHFSCVGMGRFQTLPDKTVYLEWPSKTREVVLELSGVIVALELDDANSDGTHYLKLEVTEPDGTVRAAKGSNRDMVM